MRDLASICTIEKVWPLEGKDRVQGASMVENGYEAMVSKDIQPGQLVAFIQEGAILPVKPVWEWLRKRCYKESVNGFVIKPLKFSTIRSWGLIVPLNELGLEEKVFKNFKAGEDITDLLEIRKYEPEEDASPTKSGGKNSYPKWVKFCLSHFLTRWIGRIWQKRHQNHSGGFPTDLISKSDETTIQNMKSVIETFKDETVYVSGKMEGQSFTVVPFIKNGKFKGAYVCSRNNAYNLEDKSLFWDMMRKYDIVNKMKMFHKKTGEHYILQGEQVGPGIQQNIYNFHENHWYVFTVKDYDTGKQLPYDEAQKVAESFGLRFVPVLAQGKMSSMFPDIDTAVKFAETAIWNRTANDDITSSIGELPEGEMWKDYFQHEGIVVRSVNYDKDNNIGCSFKIKNLGYAEYGLGKIHDACHNNM